MSKSEKTKQYIIEKTGFLFNTKGYAGTSLADITEATGLTKGSIYGNFKCKEDVGRAVFRYNFGRLRQNMNKYCNDEQTAFGKLSAMLAFYRDNWKVQFANGGCPLLNTAAEADDTIPSLKKEVQGGFKSWADSIADIIELGKKNGEFRKEADAEDYAYTIITLIEGGILLSKTNNHKRHLFRALDRALDIISRELKK